MAIQIRVNLAVIVALVVCEVIGYLWYSEVMPWRRHEERYLIPALCADFGLSVLIQWIISSHWGVRKIQDAVALGLYAGLLYAALVAPHSVVGPSSAIDLIFNSLHKFTIVSAMTFTQHMVRKSGY
jgi:branched-subunit amino acid ABC-type transport system permease component